MSNAILVNSVVVEEMPRNAGAARSEYISSRHRGYMVCKVVGDWLLAGLLLFLLSPVIALLALLVRITSRGPVIYRQERMGYNGKVFDILKLRTMIHNAEAGSGAVWAKRRDARVTLVGRFLRATHLDELPQLWNVLKGEMSLIGPRPERAEIVRRIERQLPEYPGRFQMRPGITGLAQLLVPPDDPGDHTLRVTKLKLAHDLYYVRQASLLLDLQIAVCTPLHFMATAITAIGHGMLRSHGMAIEREHEEADQTPRS